MDNNNIVTEISQEELDRIAGGEQQPYIGPKTCGKCAGTATKNGFTIRNHSRSILKVRFGKPLCDSCAEAERSLYRDWELVEWF